MSSEVVHVVFFDLGDTLVTSSQGWVTGAQGVLSTLRTKGVRLGVISNPGTLSRTQLLQLLPSDFDMKVLEAGDVGTEGLSGRRYPLCESALGRQYLRHRGFPGADPGIAGRL